jgi:hypothetical protein
VEEAVLPSSRVLQVVRIISGIAFQQLQVIGDVFGATEIAPHHGEIDVK